MHNAVAMAIAEGAKCRFQSRSRPKGLQSIARFGQFCGVCGAISDRGETSTLSQNLTMTTFAKSRVPAEDLWYGNHRASMNTNVLLQHVDPGQVSHLQLVVTAGTVTLVS